MRDDEDPRWVSLNSGVTNSDLVVEWANATGNTKFASFMSNNANFVDRITLEDQFVVSLTSDYPNLDLPIVEPAFDFRH